jgi:hypothetical protein
MRRLLAGAIAGAAGSSAVAAAGALEERLRGRPSVTDPGLMAARLARRFLHAELDRRERLAARSARWPYGALWGLAAAAAPPFRGWPLTGVALGAAVFTFELIALPLVGATPPPDRWRAGEIAANGLNTTLYGLVTAGVLRLLGRS